MPVTVYLEGEVIGATKTALYVKATMKDFNPIQFDYSVFKLRSAFELIK